MGKRTAVTHARKNSKRLAVVANIRAIQSVEESLIQRKIFASREELRSQTERFRGDE